MTKSSYNVQLRNYAAWILSENSQLEVAEAPFPKVGAEELVIKNYVVAVNPIDWKVCPDLGAISQIPARTDDLRYVLSVSEVNSQTSSETDCEIMSTGPIW
jgi:hypothetical protein